MADKQLKYRRILLKLSGEALMGEETHGIQPELIGAYAEAIKASADAGCQIAMVIGGGNIFRGAELVSSGIERVTGDHMGMLATAINALAMRATLEKLGAKARVMSAFPIGTMVDQFSAGRAKACLEAGEILLLTGGTGNPFFTTDTAASLRAIEIGADVMLKATKVDGVYSADPKQDQSAERYARLSYDEVIARDLKVMDITAVVMCRDHGMPLCVFDINGAGALADIVSGQHIGTIIE